MTTHNNLYSEFQTPATDMAWLTLLGDMGYSDLMELYFSQFL